MIRILCYGDSNTWGTIPDDTRRRCGIKNTYPTVLNKLLGKNYTVINEGMPSRTTNIDDVKYPKGNRNGLQFFAQCVITHDPLDYLVIMLGTNDMKDNFNRTPKECAQVLENEYIKFLRDDLSCEISKTPKIIIVAPPIIKENKIPSFKNASKKSLEFNEQYKQLALNNNCLFVDNTGLEVGDDGVHLTEKGLKTLAEKIYQIIK